MPILNIFKNGLCLCSLSLQPICWGPRFSDSYWPGKPVSNIFDLALGGGVR